MFIVLARVLGMTFIAGPVSILTTAIVYAAVRELDDGFVTRNVREIKRLVNDDDAKPSDLFKTLA